MQKPKGPPNRIIVEGRQPFPLRRGSFEVAYREVSYKYVLAEPFGYPTGIIPKLDARGCTANDDPDRPVFISQNGLLVFKTGYAWDGPSGPTFDSRCAMRAALVHDGLYQLIREGVIAPEKREAVDALFFAILKEDGMGTIRRFLWWRAVRRFAAYAAEPREVVVLRAP